MWVRDIRLTKKQLKRIDSLKKENSIKFLRYYANSGTNNLNYKKYRDLRKKYQEEGREKAKEKNPNHMAMCMLYWAEGTKSKNSIAFSNSNPDMIALFIKFIKDFFDVFDDDVDLEINGHTNNGLSEEEIRVFWYSFLSLPESCVKRLVLNKHSHFSQLKRVGKLPYGTCKVLIHRVQIVQHIYGAIQEYGNFKKDEWL